MSDPQRYHLNLYLINNVEDSVILLKAGLILMIHLMFLKQEMRYLILRDMTARRCFNS